MSRRTYEPHVYAVAKAARRSALTVWRCYQGRACWRNYELFSAAAQTLGAPEPPVPSIKRRRRAPGKAAA